ncbi:hypothetical protein NC653_024517 [Populus alba x Populus x berolinensis]|uniref:TPX2 C-terminal domain-containing protein n=1 Tax=Populus alba x Populus x berolinensis TaxID=444605 RepID=A0AAD6Q8Q6_9ROSI|nr:hypothetical protein NC653_024517 [Populus alba x Populus x berolinensis]
MGESLVAASSCKDKIGGTVASDPVLQASVSFGRFENDSLSWDKWSSFSQNKYLEEVEKCATPGSVAEKRAYFEAHYKKIAARKAELLDQEKQIEHDLSRANNQNSGDLIVKTGQMDSDFDASNGQTSYEGIRPESKLDNEWDGGHIDKPTEDAAIDVHGQASTTKPYEDTAVDAHGQASTTKPYEETAVDAHGQASSNDPYEDAAFAVHGQASSNEPYEDAAIDVQGQVPLNGRVKEKQDSELDTPVSAKLEEVALIKKEETGSQDMRELPKNLEREMESILMIKEEKVKLDHRKESPKISPMSKVRDLAMAKKKPEPPITKRPQISTLKFSKPASTSSSLSASQSSMKKVNGSSLPRSKNTPVGGNKKVTPKSLHMSLSMDSPNSETAPITTTRKSFIMEKMGDKDIVKRAFKTFQNNFNQLKSSAEERSIGAKQMPAKERGVKVSTSMTPRKENTGSFKSGGVDRRTAKLAPSSSVLKSDERAERRKEFSKKLEEKSKTEAESTRLGTKSKEEREAEIKKPRRSLNFKATPMPGFYRGQKASKSPLDKCSSSLVRLDDLEMPIVALLAIRLIVCQFAITQMGHREHDGRVPRRFGYRDTHHPSGM